MSEEARDTNRPLLEAAYERARQCWQELRVEPEAFFRRVRQALGEEISHGAAERIHALFLEDLYLVVALESGDNQAWMLFRRDFEPCVRQALGRLVLDARERDELAGDVLTSLYLTRGGAEGIPLNTYTGRGSLKGWLQVTAVRRVYRASRQRAREAWVQTVEEPVGPDCHEPSQHVGNREILDRLREALIRSIEMLPEDDRVLLRLRYQRGFQLKELGRWYGQDKSTLSKRIKMLSERLRSAILSRLKDSSGLEEYDVEGVWEALGRDQPEGLESWLGKENEE